MRRISAESDQIIIDKLEVFAHHGVYPEETKEGQIFRVNAVLYTDTRAAGWNDDLSLSTNYGEVCLFIHKWMQENTCKLLEAVAERLAHALLLNYKGIRGLELTIEKPNAPIPLPFGCVSVKITRGWQQVFLAVGSNIGDTRAYIEEGIRALNKREDIRVKRVSELIVTAPYGGVEQDDFLNGALEIETLLEPDELLEVLHRVEQEAGRTREIHWGPRTLDLDIIFYGDRIYESDTLTIPHRDMVNRSFVLQPLSEIAPGFLHPVYHKSVMELWEKLEGKPQCVDSE